MIVHFIGAGPGAADLITVRGLKLIQSCPVCLYAGSLVPEEIVRAAPQDARVIDTVVDDSRRHHGRIPQRSPARQGRRPRSLRGSLAVWRDC